MNSGIVLLILVSITAWSDIAWAIEEREFLALIALSTESNAQAIGKNHGTGCCLKVADVPIRLTQSDLPTVELRFWRRIENSRDPADFW